MKRLLRIRAIQLRKNGWSYNVISERLSISKSTLSNWLREIPYIPNEAVRKRINEGPARSNLVRHERKINNIRLIKHLASKELGRIKKRDLWMIGLGLYIGEGTKAFETVRLINSDPRVIRLGMNWFRNVCGLRDKNFRVALHTYPDIDEHKAIKFWSKITGIPVDQFGATSVDLRKNKSMKRKGRLPYGTAHITVKSCGNKKFGVELHRRIMGWIESSYNQMRV